MEKEKINILSAVQYMDKWICKNLCELYHTSDCQFYKKRSKAFRRACYTFQCKNISPGKDEAEDGGIACEGHCPCWFICNMFKRRIQKTYEDYVLSKEGLEK